MSNAKLTGRLRFAQYAPGVISLQQEWQSEHGPPEWKNVPLVGEEQEENAYYDIWRKETAQLGLPLQTPDGPSWKPVERLDK